MASRKKVLLWTAVPAGVLLAAVLAAALLLRDEAPPEDGDLRLVRRSVPPEENGFFLLDLKEEEVHLPEGFPGTEDPWDVSRAAEILRQNEAVLRKLDESLARPDFLLPEVPRIDTKMPYILAWRRMADVVSIRARQLTEEGRSLEALREALKLVRWGGRVQRAQGGAVVYLVGLAIRSFGIHAMLDVLSRADLPAADVRAILDAQDGAAEEDDGLDDVFRVEYESFVEAMERICAGTGGDLAPEWWAQAVLRSPLRGLLLKPNATRRLFAESLRSIRDGSWDPESRPGGAESGGDGTSERPRPPVNLLGHFWSRGVADTLSGVAERGLMGRYLTCLPALAFALKVWKKEKGALPESLDELVPEHLPRVPLDPFDGKPLRYSREKGVVYSIGRDGVDSGGLEGEGLQLEADEPTWRISF